MKMLHFSSKRFFCFMLSFLLLFCAAPQLVHAAALPDPDFVGGTADIISFTEWKNAHGYATNAEAAEAITAAYNSFNLSTAETAAIVVGSALFAYTAEKGITMAVESATTNAATFGRHILANLIDFCDSEEVLAYTYSIVNNLGLNADYYADRTQKNLTYSYRLLGMFDLYLGNYVDAGVLATNEGLITQKAIPADILSRMTEAAYSAYDKFSYRGYFYTYTPGSDATLPYQIHGIPAGVTTVFINSSNHYATFYNADGQQVAVGSEPYIYFSMTLSAVIDGTRVYGQWANGFWTIFQIPNVDSLKVDWGGLKVVRGTSFSNATDSNVDFDLGLNYDNQFEIPKVPKNDFTISLDEAIDLGTGDLSLDDVADVTTDPYNPDNPGTDPDQNPDSNPGFSIDLSGILDYLKKILQGILDIVTGILDLPGKIAAAIINGLKTLFETILLHVDFSEILLKLQSLLDGLVNIVTAILDLPGNIATFIIEGLESLLKTLFIPSADVVSGLEDLLDEKLPIKEQLGTWVDGFKVVLANPESYASNLTFTLDFSKATNVYADYGDSKVNFLPVDWYLQYKSTVDDIIVGVAWLVFLWNLYGRLPAIVSAVSNFSYSSARSAKDTDAK
ncbi:MAG: hypothetical protein NC489_24935 [Ruminococcus flavefaciens]|nr:hypothetical protein [Ruminococcus flavefaciens]